MLEALRNAWRIPDLRRKILYTAVLLAVARIGAYVPVPGVDAVGLAEQLGLDSGNIFGLLDLFSGGRWEDLLSFLWSRSLHYLIDYHPAAGSGNSTAGTDG